MTVNMFAPVEDDSGCKHDLDGPSELVKASTGKFYRFQRCMKCHRDVGLELDKDSNPTGFTRLWSVNDAVAAS